MPNISFVHLPKSLVRPLSGSTVMAMPRFVMVVHVSLSEVFDKMIPHICSSGAYNHKGMPCGHACTGDTGTSSSLITSVFSSCIPLTIPLLCLLMSYALHLRLSLAPRLDALPPHHTHNTCQTFNTPWDYRGGGSKAHFWHCNKNRSFGESLALHA